MTESPESSWIVPDARVVVYREEARRDCHPVMTTIHRVAKQSFTVHNIEARFRLTDQYSKNQGSSWAGWQYRCVPFDSDKARELIAEAKRSALESKARNACEEWIRDRSEANRLAAIQALRKLEVEP